MDELQVTDREKRLLQTLVGMYIREGQPLGSKRLVQSAGLPVSPATVRNIMVDLESRGYVMTPHTSAGRVPTVKGYRVFIDSLITMKSLDSVEVDSIKAQLDPDKSMPELVAAASNLLSVVTHQAGLVTLPNNDAVTLRHVEFLPLSGNRVLAILVLDEKDVQNRILHTEKEYDDVELRQAANFVNQHFAGKPLDDVRGDLMAQLRDTRRQIDRMLETAINLASQAVAPESKGAGYVVAGQSNLLDSASAENMDRLRELFEEFQQQKDILSLMERCVRADGVQIFIGEEAGLDPLVDFSFITAPYQTSGRSVGVLGVIGPTRMAYDRVIPIVDVTARMLTAALRGPL